MTIKQALEVRLKEADALIRDGERVLKEADTLRRQGLKIRAQGYQLKYRAEKEIEYAKQTE